MNRPNDSDQSLDVMQFARNERSHGLKLRAIIPTPQQTALDARLLRQLLDIEIPDFVASDPRVIQVLGDVRATIEEVRRESEREGEN